MKNPLFPQPRGWVGPTFRSPSWACWPLLRGLCSVRHASLHFPICNPKGMDFSSSEDASGSKF